MAITYTVKQMAEVARISDSSVRKWGASYLREYLSAGANPATGDRSYTDRDAAVFHTAGQLRTRKVPWEKVVEAIAAGDLMPPKSPSDSQKTATESQEKGVVLAEDWKRMTQPFKDHIDTLKSQYEHERDARVDAEKELARLKSRGWLDRLLNR
jgi:DNA-binding transcriptional MerR regulator